MFFTLKRSGIGTSLQIGTKLSVLCGDDHLRFWIDTNLTWKCKKLQRLFVAHGFRGHRLEQAGSFWFISSLIGNGNIGAIATVLHNNVKPGVRIWAKHAIFNFGGVCKLHRFFGSQLIGRQANRNVYNSALFAAAKFQIGTILTGAEGDTLAQIKTVDGSWIRIRERFHGGSESV